MGGITTFPQVLGWDFAGVIASVGSSVTDWEAGDRVLGFSPQPWTGIGVIADLVVLSPFLIAALPAELDFIAGATLPVTSLAAQQIVDAGGLQDGTTALVIGAAGAVGGLVVQLGRTRGARLIASVGSADFGHGRDLGAADAVDRAGDVAAQVTEHVHDVGVPGDSPERLVPGRLNRCTVSSRRSSASPSCSRSSSAYAAGSVKASPASVTVRVIDRPPASLSCGRIGDSGSLGLSAGIAGRVRLGG